MSVRGMGKRKRVALAVPLYKEDLTTDEQLSFRHLNHFLGKYDKFFVSPEGLQIPVDGFGVKRFGKEYFHNTVTYSGLLLSKCFYEAFIDYEFILIYQLDALVFSDQLLQWCDRGWDYIGAPWFKCADVDFVDQPRVGNGGFSLRKVESFLKVITANGFGAELSRYRDALKGNSLKFKESISIPTWKRIARRLRLVEDDWVVWNRKYFGINEDYFWSFKAISYYPEFRIATVDDALFFSFEVLPRHCYELTNHHLPFGCHAWNRYDRDFWTPFLLR